MLSDQQEKGIEVNFWDSEAQKEKYLSFEKNVYSAFRVKEYIEMIQKGLQDSGLAKNAKILDIGCSAGVSSITLAKMGYEVIGIDISSGLIEQARGLAVIEKSTAQFVVGDIAQTDYADASFDVCFMVGLLHHFPNYQPILEEIRRILKVGGLVVAVEPNLLSFSYRWSFKLVSMKSGTSPNEYPLSPLAVQQDLEKSFHDVKLIPFRETDVPFLRQLGAFGKSKAGQIIGNLITLIKNKYFAEIKKGTFFIVTCKK
ncbi:MAG: methyltransferase domain-containing protein [Methylococcaceae bacterium]|nr:methyltransferase domain-containing protein [Methylococcaceae bacterium]